MSRQRNEQNLDDRSRDEAEATEESLLSITTLSGRDRDNAIAQFHKEHFNLYERFTRSLQRRFGVPSIHFDDVFQEVTIVALETVEAWTPDQRRHWEVELYYGASGRIRALVESGHWDGIGGMTTYHRRASKLRQTRDRLRAIKGAEPTADEIVSAHNEEAHHRYKDPRRQGMIATVNDLANLTPLSLAPTHGDEDETTDMDVPVMDIGDDCALSPMESSGFIVQLVAACYERSDTLGTVAAGWLEGFDGDTTDVPPHSVPELAVRLGRSYESTRRKVLQVREVAIELLRDEYGITGVTDIADG